MTPSETPRYDADNPRYKPRMPSFRIMSQVIATAGPKGDVLGARAAAAAADPPAECESAAADAAIGFGKIDALGAGAAAGAEGFFPADSCNRVLMTGR